MASNQDISILGDLSRKQGFANWVKSHKQGPKIVTKQLTGPIQTADMYYNPTIDVSAVDAVGQIVLFPSNNPSINDPNLVSQYPKFTSGGALDSSIALCLLDFYAAINSGTLTPAQMQAIYKAFERARLTFTIAKSTVQPSILISECLNTIRGFKPTIINGAATPVEFTNGEPSGPYNKHVWMDGFCLDDQISTNMVIELPKNAFNDAGVTTDFDMLFNFRTFVANVAS